MRPQIDWDSKWSQRRFIICFPMLLFKFNFYFGFGCFSFFVSLEWRGLLFLLGERGGFLGFREAASPLLSAWQWWCLPPSGLWPAGWRFWGAQVGLELTCNEAHPCGCEVSTRPPVTCCMWSVAGSPRLCFVFCIFCLLSLFFRMKTPLLSLDTLTCLCIWWRRKEHLMFLLGVF